MSSFDAIADAYVRLRATDDGTLTNDVTSLAGKAVASVASLVAGKQILNIGVEGLDELKAAQVATTQTAAVIHSTGGEAGITQQHVEELAKSLEDLSGVGYVAATSAENLLLTFRAVSNQVGDGNDIFDRAITVANDLSKAFGEDLNSAVIQVGKALENPISGLTALQRVGIQFTADQKDQVKALVANNDLLDAQKIILGELETQVGGTAAAYGTTLSGQLDIAKQKLTDAKAELVSGFAPAVQLNASAVQFLADELQKIPTAAQGAIGGLVLVGGLTASLITPVSAVIQAVSALRTARDAKAASDAAATTSEEGLTTATEANAVATQNLAAAEGEAALAAAGFAPTQEVLLGTTGQVAVAEGEAALAAAGLAASYDAAASSAAALGVAEETVEASSVGLLGVLGPIGIGLGVLGALGTQLPGTFDKNTIAVQDFTTALEASNGALDANVAKTITDNITQSGVVDIAGKIGLSVDQVTKAITSGTQNWGQYARIVDTFSNAGDNSTTTLHQLAQGLTAAGAGGDAFTKAIVDGLNAGTLTVQQARTLITEMEGLHNGLGAATTAVQQHKQVLGDVSTALGVTTDQANASATAVTDWATAATEATKAAQDFPGFVDQLASAMDKAYQASVSGEKLSSTFEGDISNLIAAFQPASDAITSGNQSIADSAVKVSDAQRNLIDQTQKLNQMRTDGKSTAADVADQEQKVADARQQLADATSAQADAQSKLTKSLQDGKFTLDINTDAGRKNLDLALQVGDAISKLIEQRFEDTHSTQAATDAGNLYVASLEQQLEQAGLTEAQIGQLIDTMHLTPEDITTTFSTNGVDEQIIVGKYLQELDKIPPQTQTQIEALIDQGKLDDAKALIDGVANADYTAKVGTQADVSGAQAGIDYFDNSPHTTIITPTFSFGAAMQGLNAALSEAGVTIPPPPQRAAGGFSPMGETFIGGEQGYELGIIPGPGVYRSPGMQVIPHAQSEALWSELMSPSQQSGNHYYFGENAIAINQQPDEKAADVFPRVLRELAFAGSP